MKIDSQHHHEKASPWAVAIIFICALSIVAALAIDFVMRDSSPVTNPPTLEKAATSQAKAVPK